MFKSFCSLTIIPYITIRIRFTSKKLAKLDGAAAYNQFMEVYGAYLSNPRLLSAVDGVTRSKRVKKNKRNFMASLREV